MHFLILATCVAPAFAQVFKWVDDRGVTHYGERPPQGAKASEVQDKLASPPPARGGGARKDQSEPQRSGATLPPGTPPAATAPAAPKAPPTPQEEQAAARKAECEKERNALTQLRRGTTTYTFNEKGERTTVDNSAAIAEQEKRVGQQCGA